MESKSRRRYLDCLEDNGAHAWTPYEALPMGYASGKHNNLRHRVISRIAQADFDARAAT